MAQSVSEQVRGLIESEGASAPEFGVREAEGQVAGWPDSLPMPVILEVGGRSGVGYITDENGQTMLLMHDPQAPGQVLAYDAEQMRRDYDAVATPLIEDLKATSPRDIYYGQDLGAGSSESLVRITSGDFDGEIRRKVVVGEGGNIERLGPLKLGEHRLGKSAYLVDPTLRLGDRLPEDGRVFAAVVVHEDGSIKHHAPEHEAYRHSFADRPEVGALYAQLSAYNSTIIYQNRGPGAEGGIAVKQKVSAEVLENLSIRVHERDAAVPSYEAVGSVVQVAPEPGVPESQPVVPEVVVSEYYPSAFVQTAEQQSVDGGSAFIAQKIGNAESHMGNMAALDREAFSQARVILPGLERELQKSPDLSDPAVQQQIEFMFNNDFGIADSYKAVAAQFVEERLAAGGPIDMTPYNNALEALRDGDVSRAQGLLHGEVSESSVDVEQGRGAKVEEFRGNAHSIEPVAGEVAPHFKNQEPSSVEGRENVALNSALESAVSDLQSAIATGENVDPASYEGMGLSSEAKTACMQYQELTGYKYSLDHSQQVLAGVGVNISDAIQLGADGRIQIHPDKLPQEAAGLKDEFAAIKERVDAMPPANALEARCD